MAARPTSPNCWGGRRRRRYRAHPLYHLAHPLEFSDALIQARRGAELVKFIHLPVQSGDRVLAAMEAQPYRAGIQVAYPQAEGRGTGHLIIPTLSSVSGETGDFEQTQKLVEDVGFDSPSPSSTGGPARRRRPRRTRGSEETAPADPPERIHQQGYEISRRMVGSTSGSWSPTSKKDPGMLQGAPRTTGSSTSAATITPDRPGSPRCTSTTRCRTRCAVPLIDSTRIEADDRMAVAEPSRRHGAPTFQREPGKAPPIRQLCATISSVTFSSPINQPLASTTEHLVTPQELHRFILEPFDARSFATLWAVRRASPPDRETPRHRDPQTAAPVELAGEPRRTKVAGSSLQRSTARRRTAPTHPDTVHLYCRSPA